MIRPAGLLALACLAACSAGAGPGAPAPTAATQVARTPPVRLFQSASEQDFWVEHAPDRDRIVAAGTRLEIAPTGEILDVAWDLELGRRQDTLLGALAVPARLGGGYVHWTRNAVWRSPTFTGPLEPIALDPEITAIRGARPGLASVFVFTDAGPRELVAGAAKLRAVAEPGLRDFAAISERRAARLDVLGHLAATDDGGKSWKDLSPSIGLAARNLALSDTEIFLDTWDARLALRGDKVDLGDIAGRPSHESNRQFQIDWSGRRSGERAEPPWGFGPGSPLSAAVAAGGAASDDSAFGIVQTSAMRVDLRTGQVVAVAGDWFPNGLVCQPVRAPDALLFACSWDRYQAPGGYVLRLVDGGAPEIERAFSDDGTYVTDDDGALAYVGSCRYEQRYFDPEEQARAMEGGELPLAPVLCVRRGPGDWVERRVDLPEGATLVAWVAAKDGRAAAIATTSDPLPSPASPDGRVHTRSGVRLVLVDRDLRGWNIPRPNTTTGIDRRFRLRDDGTIDGWLAPLADGPFAVAVGATIDPRGEVVIHPAAPGMIATATGGPFGVAIARDGELYETTDHGRSYRAAGPSPVPPNVFSVASCSALGCALGPIVRLGWGDRRLAPRVLAATRAAPERTPRARRLACAPTGGPIPLDAPPPPPPGARQSASTGWGESIELVRDASVPEPPPPAKPGAPATPAAAPASKKPPRPSPAVLRTHTLLFRPPFAPRAPLRRVEATDASLRITRIGAVAPVLGPNGDVQLLVAGDRGDLLVAGDRITPLPSFEGRRYARADGPAGLAIANGRAVVLGDVRRRLTLEERGGATPAAPIAIGAELEDPRRRPITLGRRDDGALGVLVLDGPAPEIVGAATIDRAAASAGPIARLAPWSSLVTADHPSCQKGADPSAFRALLVIDPQLWLNLDPASLPGITLAKQGLVQVRWGRDRVCLEALDAPLIDQHTRGGSGRSLRIVARWSGEGERGAALRSTDLRQDLVCRIP